MGKDPTGLLYHPEARPGLTTFMNSQQSVIVVTGASAGIGRGAAIEIARRGFGVVATYRSRPEEAEKTVTMIREIGGRARSLPLDVSRSNTFGDFKADLTALLEDEWGTGTISGLVNNAGFGGGHAFEQMSEDAFDQYYQVLLRGPYFLTQTLLPLVADGGSILSVSSSSVRPGDTAPGYSGYAGMKAGLIVASRYLAAELGSRGIRVNTLAPGPTRTRIGDDAFAKNPEIGDALAARTTLGRLGEPEDIGKVIAFLMSDDSAWITGQDVLVSGGFGL